MYESCHDSTICFLCGMLSDIEQNVFSEMMISRYLRLMLLISNIAGLNTSTSISFRSGANPGMMQAISLTCTI